MLGGGLWGSTHRPAHLPPAGAESFPGTWQGVRLIGMIWGGLSVSRPLPCQVLRPAGSAGVPGLPGCPVQACGWRKEGRQPEGKAHGGQ